MEVSLSKRRTKRAGFTLVELLVVITIIAILASMATVGIVAAIRAARRAAISREMAQMSMTLGKYKSDHGDYPPDCFSLDLANDQTAQSKILRHIKRRFSRYRPGVPSGTTSGTEWDRMRADIAASGSSLEINNLTPTSAMVFFLGGMPDGGQPTGFSATPSNPFELDGSRLKPDFDFKPGRYKVVNGVPIYYVEYIESPDTAEKVPYVYFRARSGGYGTTPAAVPYMTPSDPKYNCPSDTGNCCPYARTVDTGTGKIDWHEAKGFQILTPGLNGEFGGSACPLGALEDISYVNDQDNNLKPEEDDNLTSFAPGVLRNMTE
ncbi:MAG: prepilin-type N-terminal cleavage/methylation domain-containing protein [Planctomycetia bacterium]|jgi:prepilin-type N-terminal cleavage/methylation domain-containing protein